MAKQITEIRSEKEEDAVLSLVSSDLLAELKGHEEEIKGLLSLLESLSDSGLLPLLSGIAKNYTYVMTEISGQITSERNRSFITNALSIYTLLSSIDTDRLAGFVNNAVETLNSASRYKGQGTVGILTLLNEMKNRDFSAGIRIVIDILKGFSQVKGE